MYKAVIVSGTPASGKTTLAKELAQRYDLVYYDATELAHAASTGYDKERDCEIIDINRLTSKLVKVIERSKEPMVIDSHLSHYLPESHVQLCLICRCSLKQLKNRLQERGYKESKVRENLDSEIFDICYNEAVEAGHKVVVVNTDDRIDYESIEPLIAVVRKI